MNKQLQFGVNYKPLPEGNWENLFKGEYLTAVEDSVILTRSEVQELIGNAFDAGYDYRSSLLPTVIAEFGESEYPNKETYISSILK